MSETQTIETEAAAAVGAALAEAPAVAQSVEQIGAMGGNPTNFASRLEGLEGFAQEVFAFLTAIHPPASTPLPVPAPPSSK